MIDLRKVDQASRMAARWLVKSCQIVDADDPNLGAFSTGYDYSEGRFILSAQTWYTSEAIRALLRIHGRTRNQPWKESAMLGGRYLEYIQAVGNEGEEAGSLWGPWLNGSEPLTIDTNYRSISGLLDLYGATGSTRYLEVSKGIVDWFIRRAYKGGGTHLNRYFPDKGVFGWPRSHILDEGSFLGLYDLTRDETYARIIDEQSEALTSSLKPSGTVSCMATPRMERDPWIRENEVSPRNMYWHLAPLLMSYIKKGDGELLENLERVGRLMREWQDSDGFLLKAYKMEGEPGTSGEPDGVATAMFVPIWLKLSEATGDDFYLRGAESALAWMLESQSVARREEGFGAFFQERILHGGRFKNQMGSIGSSYGIMACEEYLRLMTMK